MLSLVMVMSGTLLAHCWHTAGTNICIIYYYSLPKGAILITHNRLTLKGYLSWIAERSVA
jgi:hypothetical protein